MILHTDIPTRHEVDRLLASRNPASVSIYVPTDRRSANQGARIQMRDLGAQAVRQLQEGGIAKAQIAAIENELSDVVEDEEFWRYQARSLATFLTPEHVFTFRLANRLVGMLEVSDRFHLQPLLRALTFPHVAFVLALAQNSVRLIEVSADAEASEVRLPDLPKNAASAVRRSSIANRFPIRRVQGSEGRKLRLGQYARHVDQALRPFLGGLDVPLILAATEPLDSIFRSVNSYPHLAGAGIGGNPEQIPDAELANSARKVLDELYAAELRETKELFERRNAEGRGLTDVAEVARAATYGAVDTVVVDIDEIVPGFVDDQTGAVKFGEADAADAYGVLDEIARRVWLNGGRVLAVRRDDVPGRTSVAALLRYPI